MSTPTIPNGEEYFFPIIYEGNGAGQRVGKFVPFTDNGTIDNSCIFNGPDTAQLTRTPSSGGNQDTFTFSCWAKRGRLGQSGGGGSHQVFLSAGNDVSNFTFFGFRDSGSLPSGGVAESLNFVAVVGGSIIFELSTSRTFEDTSSYNHYMVVYDSGNSTSGDRIKLYVNGERVTDFNVETYPSQNQDSDVNENGVVHRVGAFNLGTNKGHFDGYLAEVNLVDGTALTPDTFGVTDTSTGRWIPKTLSGITYGTNGFRLKFQDSSALGDDTSGNGNDFTATNLASTDQTTDSPTQNHFTLDPNKTGTGNTLSEGNLKIVTSTSNNNSGFNSGKLIGNSGKYYFEAVDTNSTTWGIGINAIANVTSSGTTPDVSEAYLFLKSGTVSINGTTTASQYTAWSDGATLGIAIDMDNKQIKLYVNNTLTYTISNIVVRGREYFIMGRDYSGSGSQTITFNFGQKSFTYTPPTGFVALQQDNLPETAKGITGMVWIKNRDEARSHVIYDSSRGAGQKLQPDKTNADTLNVDGVTRFLKGGVAVGSQNQSNDAGDGNVAWNWVANSGSTSSNTDGSITSTVQANTTAGFSIIEYTGTGSAATVGHGLSSAPEWVMVKSRSNDTGDTFSVYHVGMTSASYYLRLGGNNAEASASTVWNATAPTSSVFSVGTASGTNTNTYTYLAYCWHSVDGFSKFGSYTGNGNADGPFVYTGFRPAWVMTKATSGSRDWNMYDSTRSSINPTGSILTANSNYSEATVYNSNKVIDILSNGFKLRGNNSNTNASGVTFVYMAFAEHPFVGDGTSPVTAR